MPEQRHIYVVHEVHCELLFRERLKVTLHNSQHEKPKLLVLPARLAYAWYLTVKRKIAKTKTAYSELAVICTRSSATGTAIVLARREFRLTLLFNFEG
jgi:hypothetical protein